MNACSFSSVDVDRSGCRDEGMDSLSKECCVVLVGDSGVGKTSLICKNIGRSIDRCDFSYSVANKYRWSSTVSNRKVRYTIYDTKGVMVNHHSRARSLIYQHADVFLLCFNISNPYTLQVAVNYWCPEIRDFSPSTPVVLVGCQSDLRTAPEDMVTRSLTPNEGLEVSQEIGALLYVETSSKTCARAAISAFEVAALASWGQLSNSSHSQSMDQLASSKSRLTPPPLPPKPPQHRKAISQISLNKEKIYSLECGRSLSRPFHSTVVPRFKTTKERSLSSLWNIRGGLTPSICRKNLVKVESTVTIKCGRLTANKEYEEVDVEVPIPIYETLKYYNRTNSVDKTENTKESFRTRIKKLFAK